ncbi:MAG TPA: hypothetical protein DIT48_10835 [Actinobacteria bacterium]|nr:hypothetical protein [Actinomycetota bacterium]
MDTHLGTIIAGYRIESVIGRGGMGVVYLAEHLRLKRKVALKVLAPELAEDERFRERFVQESELAASLQQGNIVAIYDAGEADGLLYIAMRFVEGTDLKTLIEREGPLEPERAAGILSQVASALDAAHAMGLIHRDVKPANVLIARDADGSEHAYLTDFGLTKRADQTTGLTKTGQFMGSVDYAAPEQFEGRPLDARTDVYSLACVAYECLTGRAPFARDREAAVMYAHLREPPPRVSSIRPDLPAELDSTLAKGMAKNPEDRYRSGGGLAQAFRTALPGGPPAKRPARTRRGVVMAGAVVSLAAALAGGLVVLVVARPGPDKAASKTARSTPPPAPADFGGVIELGPDGHPKGHPIPVSLVHSDTLFEKQIAVGDGFVWVGDATADVVSKINPLSQTVVSAASIRKPLGFAFGSNRVWMSQGSPISGSTTLISIDPKTNSVSSPIEVGPTCCGGVAYVDGSVWVLSRGSLARVDPASGNVLTTIEAGGDRLAVDGHTLWVLNVVDGTLSEVDPAKQQVGARISLSGSPTAVAIGSGAAWVSDAGGTVARIPLDGQGGTDTISVGKLPNDIVIDGGVVWVANAGEGTVSMIPEAGGAATPVRVGGFPTHLTVGEGGVWVLVEASLPAA